MTVKQAKRVLEYAQRTLFSHLQLYLNCLSSKQARKEKPIQIPMEVPQKSCFFGLDGNGTKPLDEDFAEGSPDKILDADKTEMDGVNDSAGFGATPDGEKPSEPMESLKSQKEEEVDEFDKDEPLHDLKARMKRFKLDDETKSVIKQQLVDAWDKAKT